MKTISALAGSHLRTYQAIFHHPAAHNLNWHEVHALFRHLGHVADEPNGNLRVTRNGQSLTLHPARTKEVGTTDELMTLRRFLENSETAATDMGEPSQHWLLVINHHKARLFRSDLRGTVPQQILPHEPADFFRHAPHSQDFARGQEKPDPNSFFEPIAKALAPGGQILVFGRGTGSGSEMEQFITWAKAKHPALAARIIGSQVIDENHLTDPQLLAKVREFYAGPRAG